MQLKLLSERIIQLEEENSRLRRMVGTTRPTAAPWEQIRDVIATMRGIIRCSAMSCDTVEHYAAHLSGRLDTLARVQSNLVGNSGGGVGLHTIVSDELLAHLAREGDRAEIIGPGIYLTTKAAEVFSLVMYELVMNAVTYGSLGSPEGTVSASWRVLSDGDATIFDFDWEEIGLADNNLRASEREFGVAIIRRCLKNQFRTDITSACEGGRLRYNFAFTLTNDIGLLERSVAEVC